MRKPFRLLGHASLLMLLVATGLLIASQRDCSFLFEYRDQFRITNATGIEVAVTSAHTKQTTRIPNGSAALVPHGRGDIIIRQRGGKTWVYRNVSRMALGGPPYEVIKTYPVPFGGGTLTVNLLLEKDGRIYVVPPNAKNVNVEELEQPEGFPLKPDEARGIEEGVEQSSHEEKDSRK